MNAKNLMNSARIICLLAMLVATAISCDENPISHYPAWGDVVKDTAVARGWIPSFVPKSATNIWEQHDLDTNVGVLRFSAPPCDLALMAASLHQVPGSDFAGIAPRMGGAKEWWPVALAEGDVEKLVRIGGFVIYSHTDKDSQFNTPASPEGTWYFAIHVRNGSVYAWHNH